MKQKGLVSAAVILSIAFICLAFLANKNPYFAFDPAISTRIQSIDLPVFPTLLDILNWIGFTPQSYFISAAIILFLLLRRRTWEGIVSLVSVLISTGAGRIIKPLIARPRPSADLVHVGEQLHDYSFPSGHVLYFVTFFGFLLFLTFAVIRPSWIRLALATILSVMVALIGVSRIFVGNHWFSDTLGGYLLGGAILSLTILAYIKGRERYVHGDRDPLPAGHSS